MYCMLGMLDYRDWCRCMDRIAACDYIDTTYVSKIKRISKKLIKMVSYKVRTIKRLQRARESCMKSFEESEDEDNE